MLSGANGTAILWNLLKFWKFFKYGCLMFALFLHSWPPGFMSILGRYADNGLRCQMCLFHPSHCPLLNLYWVGLCIGPAEAAECTFRIFWMELPWIATDSFLTGDEQHPLHSTNLLVWNLDIPSAPLEVSEFNRIHIQTHDRLQRISNRSYDVCFIWKIFCVTVLRRFVFSPCSAP